MNLHKRKFLATASIALSFVLSVSSAGKGEIYLDPSQPVEMRVNDLMQRMTLEEKVGQMNQYAPENATGPRTNDTTVMTQIAQGRVGSVLNVTGAEKTRYYQEQAMKSRLHIPLIMGHDVIHGLYTTFPIPLAETASFDLEMIRAAARCAAIEASAAGIHWTFAPMVDISHDARWGRVMEGAGEDPWLGSEVARARVTGFQGDNMHDINTVMACCKHFGGYGAAIAGKDYNTVDMSPGYFANYYMPPYKAACEAGVATYMNAFNDFDNIPCTASDFLMQHLLRNTWEFTGFVVSDWGSVGETVKHRYAADAKDAAMKCANAGCDMDMESRCYINHLVDLVRNKEISESVIDDAVRRILTKKFELGLFDDPFRYCDPEREKAATVSDAALKDALRMAERSIVLLKNEGNILPLDKKIQSIALIGALADSKQDQSGFWAAKPVREKYVTLREALVQQGFTVNYEPAYDLATLKTTDAETALEAAQKSDVVIVCVGERAAHSGEAKSKADININESQQQLVQALAETGKPVVTLIMGGRPQIFNTIRESSPAILCTWWLGTLAGPAICNVLFGDYNPSARLPMTFPKHIGQIPIFYNYKSTGRPGPAAKQYAASYIDMDYLPAYPFGYGLSYTTFAYSDLNITPEGRFATVSVKVRNTGNRDGEEVVMLYIRDEVASVTRPIKELKGFRKIMIKAGEEQEVVFELSEKELGFYNNKVQYVVEPGDFTIMTGPCGGEMLTTLFTLKYI